MSVSPLQSQVRANEECQSMQLTDLLTIEAVVPSLKAGSKKQALQELSQVAARITGLPARDVFETLLQREKLGSTGLGPGIAIPHGEMPDLDRRYAVLARAETPIEFVVLEDHPVAQILL